jgi:hypothetical protein
MSIEYDLTLAGGSPIDQVAARAFPDPHERPAGTAPLLSADLRTRYGFNVAVLPDDRGYVEAQSDDGRWVWEPEPCVSLGFRLDKSEDLDGAVTSMLAAVRRVLDSGPEDAAFTFDNDLLLFTRLDGVFTKHRRATWWDHYPVANQLFPE